MAESALEIASTEMRALEKSSEFSDYTGDCLFL